MPWLTEKEKPYVVTHVGRDGAGNESRSSRSLTLGPGPESEAEVEPSLPSDSLFSWKAIEVSC